MSTQSSGDKITNFSKLNKNTTETIFVPTESSYFLISPKNSLSQLKSIADSFLDSYQIIHFFKDTKSLIKVLSPATQVYLRLIISILNPGPVIMALKDKEGDSFLAYIPNHPELLDFLSISENHWIGVLPKTEDNLPFISAQRILEDKNLSHFKIIDSTHPIQNILPAVIDCRQENLVTFLQEGVVDSKELRSVLPKKIQVEIDLQANFLSMAKLTETSTRFRLATADTLKTESLSLVLGSKEKLQETFKFNNLGYFVYKELDNFILFNIGSSNFPSTIAKGLYKDLYETRKFGISTVLILNQNWGKSKWSKIIQQILTEISIDTETENAYELNKKTAFQNALGF